MTIMFDELRGGGGGRFKGFTDDLSQRESDVRGFLNVRRQGGELVFFFSIHWGVATSVEGGGGDPLPRREISVGV